MQKVNCFSNSGGNFGSKGTLNNVLNNKVLNNKVAVAAATTIATIVITLITWSFILLFAFIFMAEDHKMKIKTTEKTECRRGERSRDKAMKAAES